MTASITIGLAVGTQSLAAFISELRLQGFHRLFGSVGGSLPVVLDAIDAPNPADRRSPALLTLRAVPEMDQPGRQGLHGA